MIYNLNPKVFTKCKLYCVHVHEQSDLIFLQNTEPHEM